MAYIQNICTCFSLISCLLIIYTEGRQLKAFHKESPPSTTPNQTNKFGSYDARNINDFRPTAPGTSPGIGHSSAEQKEPIQDKAPSFTYSTVSHTVAGTKDDFRPTGPGHSPGVGHSFQNEKKGSNA